MSILALPDIKAHMSVYTDDDDAMIQNKIDAAESWIGQFLGADLATFEPTTGANEGILPAHLQEAVRQLVAHLYNNREASLVGTNIVENCPGLFDLLAPSRCYVF